MSAPTPADHLALAAIPCSCLHPCRLCRRISQRVTHELAAILR